MPKTKNALIRQRVIDRCLRSPKNYSILDMMEACNEELEAIGLYPVTSTNTIRADLDQITTNYPDAIIDQERDGRNIYYRYRDRNYSIFNIPFSDEELLRLTQTISILSRFEGLPQFEWIDEFIHRFKSSIRLDLSTDPIVGFEENIDLEGRGFFSELFMAISNKQVLSLIYKSFKREAEQELIVHPYYLKQYNSRWFMIGHSENVGKLSVFAFDRIISFKALHRTFIPNTEYDFREYFDEMIGVSRNSNALPEEVRLWISSKRWPYVRTKPLHGTQRFVSEDDAGVIVRIKLYINKELEQQILSFGKDVCVLSPQSLRERIRRYHQQALSLYKDELDEDEAMEV